VKSLIRVVGAKGGSGSGGSSSSGGSGGGGSGGGGGGGGHAPKLCFQFQKGQCTRGGGCRYSHDV
jgi:hypothetical protein